MSEDKACREEFEVWARDNGYVVTRTLDGLDGEWYSQQGTDRAWDVWQACWSRAAKPAVPEGFRLVPIEPTYGMEYAYEQSCAGEFYIDGYHAMLAAAPTPPAAPKEPT